MRRVIGGGAVFAVLALALWASPGARAAQPPVLTLQGPTSGPVGTPVVYTYAWDYADCEAGIISQGGTDLDSFEVALAWNDAANTVTTAAALVDPMQGCTATISASVPSDEPVQPVTATGSIIDTTNGADLGGTATGSPPFEVTPLPTPTPIPTPTPPIPTPTPPIPTPTPPIPTPTPTAPPTTSAPGSTPSHSQPSSPRASALSTLGLGPTPTPAAIVAAILGSTSQGSVAAVATGAGGDSPEGGAACGGNVGRAPTLGELSQYADQLAGGVVSTTVESEILGSKEYYANVGGNDLGFITRLYDDVLQRDPTSAEISTAEKILQSSATGRSDVASAVILSRETRSDRIRRGFERLLGRDPSETDESSYLYSLPSPTTTAITYEGLVGLLAASDEYYTHAGGTARQFVYALYQSLLSRQPYPAELSSEAAIMARITGGDLQAREGLARTITSSLEYHNDEITGFYLAYFHSTCAQLDVGRCATVTRDPTQSELRQWLRSFASGSTEEDLIASLLSGNEYYTRHGGGQETFVNAVYKDLLGRSPSARELSAAQSGYANSSKGRFEFAKAMVQSDQYHAVLVRLSYRQLLLRDPTPSELQAGAAILAGGSSAAQTPDVQLIATIISTPEYYGDAGPYDFSFVRQAVIDLLRRPDATAEESGYLSPAPHGAAWQQSVALMITSTSEYRTDYIRGTYEKYLGQSTCSTPIADAGFIGHIPGGWAGLGVLLLALGGGVSFVILRRHGLPGRLGPGRPTSSTSARRVV